MPQFLEHINSEDQLEFWRSAVRNEFTENDAVCAGRLNELQQQAASHGWRATFGHEIEYVLEYQDGRLDEPDKEDFYMALVRHLCKSDTLPPEIGKGLIIEPGSYPALILTNQWAEGTYNPDQPDSTVSEIRTAPAEWEEAEKRYWGTLRAIGSLAADRGLKARIAATHMSTVLALRSNSKYQNQRTLGLRPDILAATQYARRLLQPFEPYAGYIPGHESFPSKAGRWAIHDYRIETRYPGFAIVDPRPEMLATLSGLQHALRNQLSQANKDTHRTRIMIELYSVPYPELQSLNELMLWDADAERMVLPEQMERDNIMSAFGESNLQRLDKIVENMTQGLVTRYDQDDARILRDIVGVLRLQDGKLSALPGTKYSHLWEIYLDNSADVRSLVPYIAADSPYEITKDPIRARKQAAKSPEVTALLGRELVRSLTSARKAAKIRRSLALAA